MSKFKVTNPDEPIEIDLYQDIPSKDPDTGIDQVDGEGNILVKRYVTRSINSKGIANIKNALPQINTNKEAIAVLDKYAKDSVASITSDIGSINDNLLSTQTDLSDLTQTVSVLQGKINGIQGIDIDVVQADVDALKKSAYLITGGVLKGDVSIQTPNTAVLTLTPKGSSSYASFSTNNDVLDCTTTWGKVFKASEEGKYFYGLADKATADKRGQDVTSYIRSITGANATLTITKGDNTSQSLSINNVLQATKAIQDKNGAQIDTTYFKAANGSFTGSEYNRSITNSYLRFSGGKTRNGGAVLHLHSYDHDNGEFALGATVKGDGSDYKYFRGTPTGSLTWNGKNIVRSINNINADAFGNVAFTQLVTGLVSSTYLAAAKGNTLVSSTAPAGAYIAFTRGASKNGVFIQDVYDTCYEVHYISNANINANNNAPTKTVVLLDEAGNSSFPGKVSGTFSGNLSGTASHATSADSATKASQNASGHTLADTIVKSIAINGRTITVTKLDGKTYTLTTQDTNTTYSKLSQFTNDSGYITSSGSCASANDLNSKAEVVYGTNRLNYFNVITSITSGAKNVANPTNDWYYHLMMNHGNANGFYFDIASAFHQNAMYYRRVANGSEQTWIRLIDSANIGSQSVNYAKSAGSVAWGNVSGRPTNVSQFTNNSGYITDGHNFASGVKVSGYTITVG